METDARIPPRAFLRLIFKRPDFKGRGAAAFTLVEILTVLCVMTVLMVLSMPFVVGTLQANRLTSGGESLLYRLSRLQQIVATTNRPAEVRFYKYEEDGLEGYHAYQLFTHDEATGGMEPLEGPVYFSGDSLVIMEGTLSPLLDSGAEKESGTWPKTADEEPFSSMGATYFRIAFLSNGSTTLNVPLRKSYLTLASAKDVLAGNTAPANYYTIQVDPVSGRARSFRP